MYLNSTEGINKTMDDDWLSNVFTSTSLAYRIIYRLNLTSLRHTYFIITPNETMFATMDEVPNYNVEVSTWWLLFILFEYCFLAATGSGGRFALNDSITSVCAGMLSQCFKFGGRTIAIFVYVFLWNNFRLVDNAWDSVATWIFCLLFQDLMYYFGHRAVHEAGFMWGLHTIHHSSEYYNFSTALRQAAIQDVGLAIYDVLQAFFIPPPIFLVHRYFSEIYQFTLHTSLFDTYGPLGLVLNTPSHHRVHHGRNPYCIDRNYGAIFIIWDKIFGTFEAERPDERPVYGTIERERNFNQLWLQFHTLKEILVDRWRMKDEKGEPIFRGIEKLKAIYFPPIYKPGMRVHFFFHWWTMDDHLEAVPLVEDKVVRYDPPIPIWQKVYCVMHFLLLLAIFFHFEYDRAQLTVINFTLQLAFFVLTMQCLGALFDKKDYAPFLELIRCVGVIAYHLNLMTDNTGFRSNRLFNLAIYSLSATFWSTLIISKMFIARFDVD